MNENQSPQSVIEQKMKEISDSGSYDMVHLFSNEGLPLAEYYSDRIIEKDRLAEMSILFRELKKMADVMGRISSIKEMVVEGYNQRKIIFRFFSAFNQDVVLAIVVPPKRSYRALTNALIRTIENTTV